MFRSLRPPNDFHVGALVVGAHIRPEPRRRRRHHAEELARLRNPRVQRLLVRVVERVAADAVRADALARLRRTIPIRSAAVPLTVDEREHPLIAFDQRPRVTEERHTGPDAKTRVVDAQHVGHPIGVILRPQDVVGRLRSMPFWTLNCATEENGLLTALAGSVACTRQKYVFSSSTRVTLCGVYGRS